MTLQATGSALVAGSVLEETMSATRHVKVIRSFYYQGKPLAVDSTKELPTAFALEMRAAGKLELIEAPAKVATHAASDTGNSGKGGKNAG